MFSYTFSFQLLFKSGLGEFKKGSEKTVTNKTMSCIVPQILALEEEIIKSHFKKYSKAYTENSFSYLLTEASVPLFRGNRTHLRGKWDPGQPISGPTSRPYRLGPPASDAHRPLLTLLLFLFVVLISTWNTWRFFWSIFGVFFFPFFLFLYNVRFKKASSSPIHHFISSTQNKSWLATDGHMFVEGGMGRVNIQPN